MLTKGEWLQQHRLRVGVMSISERSVTVVVYQYHISIAMSHSSHPIISTTVEKQPDIVFSS